MNGKGCMTVARRLSAVLLLAKARGRLGLAAEAAGLPEDGTETLSLTRLELEIMLAAAVDDGWRRAWAAGKGQPKPEGLLSDLPMEPTNLTSLRIAYPTDTAANREQEER